MNQRLMSYAAFALLCLLWVGFGAALLIDPELLHGIWQAFRGLSWVIQGLVTLASLPVVLGLWVWQTAWPLWLRLILVIGLAWATLYTFFPKKADSQPTIASVKS